MARILSTPILSRRHALGAMAGLFAAAHLPPAFAAAAVEQKIRLSPPGGLYELVFNRATGLVHVAAVGPRGGDQAAILALDPGTLEVKGSIPMADPAFGLAVNDRTGLLYTTNTRTGSVSIIDPREGRIVGSVVHGEKAHLRQAVVDPAANRIYVSAPGFQGAPSQVWVIDGATHKLLSVIEEGLGEAATGLTLDAAGNRLFVTRLMANEVAEIDLSSGKVARSFASGGESAVNAAYEAANQRLFVTNQKSGNLAVLDATSGAVLKSIETGAGALSIALNPAKGLVLIANRGAGTVSVIDAGTLELRNSLATGTHPNTIAFNAEGSIAYVTNKAKSAGRGQPPIDDPNGDTVSLIRL
ncbi:YncE family protein [Pseudoroseomonas globiformis]|uniref:YncE family protein n=1 Tax=Teichococcus globiformis TaxID=2307229 RepID=A0ABV7FY28_9PROT